jgi:integrase
MKLACSLESCKAFSNCLIKHRFTEHDLRAKCASDAETLERARQLLGHAEAQITERVYRRKPDIIRPQL